MRTSDGIEGIGYCFAFGREDARVLRLLVDNLAHGLIGADAVAITRLWQRMWDSLVFLGQSGAGVSAIAALDIALWDIAGKRAAVPLWQLFGGNPYPVPVYGSGGSLDTPLPELVAEMERHAAAGYPAVKMKIGYRLEEDLDRVDAVRRAIGRDVKLILDANQRWSAKEAVRDGTCFAKHDIWWLEEPVPAARIVDCAQVRAALPFAVATGETNFTVDEFERLLDAHAADILMPNLQRVGGITPWREVAAAANLRGVAIASHVYPEINAHLMAAVPNGLTLEVIPWWPQLFNETLEIRAGKALPPRGPGLGLSLDPALVARHRVD